MEHHGRAFAADEVGAEHVGRERVISVHERAAITWMAIFPMATLGMVLFATLVPNWNVVLRALVLTLFVVPITVYFAVPRLLVVYGRVLRLLSRQTPRRPWSTIYRRRPNKLRSVPEPLRRI